MDSWDIVKIAAGSGVVTAVVNFAVTWFKEGKQRQAQRRFEAEIDAIHLISKLDALAVECANNYWEFHDLWSQSRGTPEENHLYCSKPSLDIPSEHLSKIDRTLACRIAWLENDVNLGVNGIRARWEAHLDTDEARAADANLVGYFGHEALSVSRKLKSTYKLNSKRDQWGMSRIEEQLSKCAGQTEKFFKEDS